MQEIKAGTVWKENMPEGITANSLEVLNPDRWGDGEWMTVKDRTYGDIVEYSIEGFRSKVRSGNLVQVPWNSEQATRCNLAQSRDEIRKTGNTLAECAAWQEDRETKLEIFELAKAARKLEEETIRLLAKVTNQEV